MSLPETKVTKTLQNHAERCQLCFIPLKKFGKKRSFSSIYFPVLLGGSPLLMWWIPFFLYMAIRRLLFQTIWCLLFWNRRKIERLTQFPKKSLKWWKTGVYLKIGGGRKFFWKLRQSLNFSPISKKKASNCLEEQSPYRKNNEKIYMYIYKGGGSPSTFSLPLKNCWYENWWAPPPNVEEGIFFYIFL